MRSVYKGLWMLKGLLRLVAGYYLLTASWVVLAVALPNGAYNSTVNLNLASTTYDGNDGGGSKNGTQITTRYSITANNVTVNLTNSALNYSQTNTSTAPYFSTSNASGTTALNITDVNLNAEGRVILVDGAGRTDITLDSSTALYGDIRTTSKTRSSPPIRYDSGTASNITVKRYANIISPNSSPSFQAIYSDRSLMIIFKWRVVVDKDVFILLFKYLEATIPC